MSEELDRYVAELTRVKDEVAEWSRRNFPNNTPYEPLLGMGEELGEIKHAVLKMRQGIRGTREEHEAAIRDGFGDLLIYFLDHAGRRGIGFDMINCNFSRRPTTKFGSLALALGALEEVYDRLRLGHGAVASWAEASRLSDVLDEAVQVMRGFGLDPLDVLNETWEQVKRRDWTKNAATGAVAEKGGEL